MRIRTPARGGEIVNVNGTKNLAANAADLDLANRTKY
jgi:hypothetical protein